MSHYKRLGVAESADLDTIHKAFRRRSKELHPDTTTLPAERAAREFQQLLESYELLSDPVRRRAYDLQRPRPNMSPPKPATPKSFVSSSWQGIGERRPLSGGEWFSLVLLAAALVLSLVVGLGLAAAQGREWQVAPTWLADEQTERIAIDPTDVGTAYGGHPAQSTLNPSP